MQELLRDSRLNVLYRKLYDNYQYSDDILNVIKSEYNTFKYTRYTIEVTDTNCVEKCQNQQLSKLSETFCIVNHIPEKLGSNLGQYGEKIIVDACADLHDAANLCGLYNKETTDSNTNSNNKQRSSPKQKQDDTSNLDDANNRQNNTDKQDNTDSQDNKSNNKESLKSYYKSILADIKKAWINFIQSHTFYQDISTMIAVINSISDEVQDIEMNYLHYSCTNDEIASLGNGLSVSVEQRLNLSKDIPLLQKYNKKLHQLKKEYVTDLTGIKEPVNYRDTFSHEDIDKFMFNGIFDIIRNGKWYRLTYDEVKWSIDNKKFIYTNEYLYDIQRFKRHYERVKTKTKLNKEPLNVENIKSRLDETKDENENRVGFIFNISSFDNALFGSD